MIRFKWATFQFFSASSCFLSHFPFFYNFAWIILCCANIIDFCTFLWYLEGLSFRNSIRIYNVHCHLIRRVLHLKYNFTYSIKFYNSIPPLCSSYFSEYFIFQFVWTIECIIVYIKVMLFKDILLEKCILIHKDTRVIVLVSNLRSAINTLSLSKYDNISAFLHLLNFLDQSISISFFCSSRKTQYKNHLMYLINENWIIYKEMMK